MEKFIGNGRKMVRHFKNLDETSQGEITWPCLCGGEIKWTPHPPEEWLPIEEKAPWCKKCELLFNYEFHENNKVCVIQTEN